MLLTNLGSDEQRLVLRAQAGDATAFDQLLRRHERELFRHVHRMVRDEETAYEVLQETYVAIFRSIRKLRDRAKFRAWCYGVATRVALKTLSKRAGRRDTAEILMEPRDQRPLPDSLASAHEQLQELLDHVAVLSPKLRSVVLLHFFEGLTLREVAAALEISIGTAKSRLNAGLVKLREARDGGAI